MCMCVCTCGCIITSHFAVCDVLTVTYIVIFTEWIRWIHHNASGFLTIITKQQRIITKQNKECSEAIDILYSNTCYEQPLSWAATLMSSHSHEQPLSWAATLMSSHSHEQPLSGAATLMSSPSQEQPRSWAATLLSSQPIMGDLAIPQIVVLFKRYHAM